MYFMNISILPYQKQTPEEKTGPCFRARNYFWLEYEARGTGKEHEELRIAGLRIWTKKI